MPDLRPLGTFASVAEAVAAAGAAQLPAGAYGSATVGPYLIAIDGAGKVYLLAQMGGSGLPQRPPTPPKGQQ